MSQLMKEIWLKKKKILPSHPQKVSGIWKKIIIIDIYHCLEWQYILCAFIIDSEGGRKQTEYHLILSRPLQTKFTKLIKVKSVCFEISLQGV